MNTYYVTDTWYREQDNPLNGWQQTDDGVSSVYYTAENPADALTQWAANDTPIDNWAGMELYQATGYIYQDDDLTMTIDEINPNGFTALSDTQPRVKLEVTVNLLED